MALERHSPCKVNLILNILGRRPDGYHDLETVFLHVPLHDTLSFEHAPQGIRLTCNRADLPVDESNLVHRAATQFLAASGIASGISIHLGKHLPLAAGLGGGSSNAAHTLLGLNDLFGQPLGVEALHRIAATLGSDVNFFLQGQPALATGRGECIEPLAPFRVLSGMAMFLYHPGFGISTPWAYRELGRFPSALNGTPGRARALAQQLAVGDMQAGMASLYNSLEAPALGKYPVLALYQEFLRARGAVGTLMSGSGSTTFALFPDAEAARAAIAPFESRFGAAGWLRVATL